MRISACRAAIVATFGFVVMCQTACAHGDAGTSPEMRAKSIVVAPDTLTLVVGHSGRLSATVRDAAGAPLDRAGVRWSVGDSTVATVDQSGGVSARTFGTTTVLASSGAVSTTTPVIVSYANSDSASVRSSDSVHVAVASGSTIDVPVGALPAGVSVALSQVGIPSDVDTAGMGVMGSAVEVDLSSGSATALRTSSTALRSAALSSRGVRLKIRQLVTDSRADISRAFVVLHDAGKAVGHTATTVAVNAADAAVTVDNLGRRFVEVSIYDPIMRSPVTEVGGKIAYTAMLAFSSTTCDPSAWSVYPASGIAPSPNKVPIILIHGWQPLRFTCGLEADYSPDVLGESWGSLIATLSADPSIRDRYEVLIAKYPTFYSIDQNAESIAPILSKLIGNREAIVIAHSMGGLLAAKYMIGTPANRVHELVTLGTPFTGSPLADPLQLDANARSTYIQLAQQAKISEVMDYLSGGPILGSAGAGDLASNPRSPFLGELANGKAAFASKLVAIAGNVSTPDLIELASSSASTVDDKFSAASGLLLAAMQQGPSDGVVPLASAQAYGTPGRTFTLDHFELPTTASAMASVKSILADLVGRVAAAPSAIVRVSGDAQVGSPSGPLPEPIVVRVQDAYGVGAPGIPVTFSVTSGGGSASVGSTTTDASGEARASWTLGPTEGLNSLQVSAAGVSSGTAQFTATAVIRTATTLAVIGGSSTTIAGQPFPDQPRVQVQDAFGQPVTSSAASVTASVINWTGVLTGTNTAIASGGDAQFTNLGLSVHGGYTIQFSSPGLTPVVWPVCGMYGVSAPFTIFGNLNSSSCSDGDAGLTSGDLFAFSVGAQTGLRLSTNPTAFASRVALRASRVAAGYIYWDAPGGVAINHKWLLPANAYTSLFGTPDGGTGPYSLFASRESEGTSDCEVVTLLGQDITTAQALSTSGCSSGGYFESWFAVYSWQACTISMSSASFDTYLEAYDQDGNLLAGDDDGGGSTNSRLSLSTCSASDEPAPHQVLFIKATSAFSESTGPFILQIAFDASHTASRSVRQVQRAASTPVTIDARRTQIRKLSRDKNPHPRSPM